MKVRSFLGLAVLALQFAFASQAVSQSFNIEDVTAVEGSASVEVDWQLTAGGGVQGIGIDIAFDDDLITPVVDGAVVVGCFVDVTAEVPPSCQLINPTTIRVAISNFPGTDLVSANGRITFNIASTAAENDSSALTLSVASVVPANTPVSLSNGSVTIVGSDAVLTLSPASFDFGSQDINDPAQQTTFTIGNDGVEDALTISDVSFGPGLLGAFTSPFTVSDNCDGAEIAPQGTCELTVTFDPEEAGSFAAVLTVSSDAGTETADVDGEATATADLVVTPPFGPVNLGSGLQGDTLTAQGSVVNNGSADATVQCTLVESGLTGEVSPGIFSTTLPSTTINVVAGADPIPFSVSCALPAEAEDGDVFTAEIQCSVDGGPVTADTTHVLSCSVSEFEPLPVPTLSNWNIALLALLMLLVGGISIRLFRT